MTAHTPGPWVIDRAIALDDGEELLYVQTPELRGTPGHDYRMEYGAMHICRVYHDSEANARLIAAAPDLLAACKAIHGYLKPLRFICGTPEYAAVEQAIAKAEGK